jgi:hypothetical protein
MKGDRQLIYPEEAVLTRAVRDAITFVSDSDSNKVDALFKSSIKAASDESGVDLHGEAVRKLYTSVFTAAVTALIEWDFDTHFEHV